MKNLFIVLLLLNVFMALAGQNRSIGRATIRTISVDIRIIILGKDHRKMSDVTDNDGINRSSRVTSSMVFPSIYICKIMIS